MNKFNLQLFAGEQEESEEQNVEGEVQDGIQEDTQDDDAVHEDQDEHEEPQKTVPLAKYLEEKKRRRELDQAVKRLSHKELENEQRAELQQIREKIKSKGYDEDFADLMEEIYSGLVSKIPAKEDTLISDEIDDLQEEYPDISGYKKEIASTVKKFKKAGEDITVEEAYMYVSRKGGSSMSKKEMQTHLEQVEAVKRNAKNKKVATSTSDSTKDVYKLTDEDKKVLTALQQAQPNAGWTTKKFYERTKKK